MKKIILSFVAIATITLTSLGQAPEGFKYQAVVRDAGSTILINQAVGVKIDIIQTSPLGTVVYEEVFSPTTNAYGLINLEIGSGTLVSGDFTAIDWGNGPYFIKTAIDVTGGTIYAEMGTSQLISVPYALHASMADNVTNDQVDDADADPTNEMNTGIVLNGTDLEVTDGNGTIVTDLSLLQDGVNDADSDPTNELQANQLILNTATVVGTAANNYDVSNIGILFVVPTTSWVNISGLSGGVTGQVLHIVNAPDGGTTCCMGLYLQDENPAGIQQFKTSGSFGVDWEQGTTIVFDGTYWRVVESGM